MSLGYGKPAATVQAATLTQLGHCGMTVLQRPCGRFVVAVCFPDPKRCELTPDEAKALDEALRTLSVEAPS